MSRDRNGQTEKSCSAHEHQSISSPLTQIIINPLITFEPGKVESRSKAQKIWIIA